MRIIGTAGHVDHGKTTLVRRLTSIDPDRLAEEKAREMTIDLGFAWFALPGGEIVGVVDVPGHRDFIENMLAGVGGIDAVLLVVAADEGIMPQTREHLAILDLLGITNGLVVLTKIDMVDDPEWIDLIESEIRQALTGTALHAAAVVRVSAHTGAGIPQLEQQILALLEHTPSRADYGHPRLPVDRVFSMSGFGTVVTGTLAGGTLRIGDEVEIQPQGFRGRIRGLQSYKQTLETAHPGSRVAVNLSGVERSAVKRGAVLAYPGELPPTVLVDVYFRHLPDAARPLKHHTEVKFYSGTAESTARVRLLGAETLAPGEEGWLQLVLSNPLALVRGDRFILRAPSPAETIGGGEVINAAPGRRWKRFQQDLLLRLETQRQGTPAERLAQAAAGSEPVKRQVLQKATGLENEALNHALEDALRQGLLIAVGDGLYLAGTSVRAVLTRIENELAGFHRAEPLRLGMLREELRSRTGLKLSTLNALLELQDVIVAEGNLLRLTSHTIVFTPQQRAAVDDLLALMHAAPYTPPSYFDAIKITGEPVLRGLIDVGEIVQVASDVIFTRDAYQEMIAGVLEVINAEGSVTAANIRDRYGSSRKYAIALLEHLDSLGITTRSGDARVRGRNAPR